MFEIGSRAENTYVLTFHDLSNAIHKFSVSLTQAEIHQELI